MLVEKTPTFCSQPPTNNIEWDEEEQLIEALLEEEEFLEEKEKEGKSNLVWAASNLIMSIIGSGVVAVPFYLSKSGPILFPFFLFLYALLSQSTLVALFSIASRHPSALTFPLLCKIAGGTTVYLICCFSIFIFNFGVFVSNLLLLGQLGPNLIQSFFHYNIDRSIILVIFVISLAPLAFLRNIAKYSLSSILAVLSALVVIFVVVGECYHTYLFHSNLQHFPQHPDLSSISLLPLLSLQTFSSLGGIAYLFACQDISFSVFHSLSNPTIERYKAVVKFSIWTSFVLFLLVGVSGFLLFLNQTDTNILNNFSTKSESVSSSSYVGPTFSPLLLLVSKLMLLLNVAFGIPFFCFMPRVALDGIVRLVLKQIHEKYPNATHVLLTIIVISLSLMVSEYVTNLGAVYEFFGGLGGVVISLLLPGLVVHRLGEKNLKNKLLVACSILFGLFVVVISVLSVFFPHKTRSD